MVAAPDPIEFKGYRDVYRIGQGGLGDVYRATRVSTGATVAIKVLRDVSDESVVWTRVQRELTALVSLTGHANVIHLIEMIDRPDGPALVMEYAPGGSVGTLADQRGGPLSIGEVVLVGRQVASALAAAHAQGIVHRDVKPHNLLIDAYGQVKLCDFGIAALTRSEEFQARTHAVSLTYASPEDLEDDGEIGPPSDIYSLGATLLRLRHGSPPSLKQRLAPWEPPGDTSPEGMALDRVIAACLQPRPDQRPTAAELCDDFEQLAWAADDRPRALVVPDAPVEPVECGAADLAMPEWDGDHLGDGEVEHVAADDELAALLGGPSDTTVYRPDRPRLSSPPSTEPRRRWWMVVAVLVAALGVGAVIGWVRRDPGPVLTAPPSSSAAPPVVEVAPRPDGLDELARIRRPMGVVGECLVQEPGTEMMRAIECDQPHDLQRVGVGQIDADLDPDDRDGEVTERCVEAFTEFVGRSPLESEFGFSITRPSASSWAAGDREYQCFVGIKDARLTGDAAGINR